MKDSTEARPSIIAAIGDPVVMLDIESAFDAAGYSVFPFRPGVTTENCLTDLADCRGMLIDPDVGWLNVEMLKQVMHNRSIPAVVFAYGDGDHDIPDWLAMSRRVDKPFKSQMLVDQINGFSRFEDRGAS